MTSTGQREGKRASDRSAWGALLVGVSDYDDDSMPNIPATLRNVADLKRVLTDPALVGIPSENITVVTDPSSQGQVMNPLSNLARKALDVLVVYFAGHGLANTDGSLYLAMPNSVQANMRWTGIKDADLHEVLRDSVALTRVLILDCCFSGRMTDLMGGDVDSQVAGAFTFQGTVTIASSPPNVSSVAPHGAAHTVFTGELLSALTEGDLASREGFLTLESVYSITHRRMQLANRHEPQIVHRNFASRLPFVRNAAYTHAAEPHELTRAATEARIDRPPPEVAWLRDDPMKSPTDNGLPRIALTGSPTDDGPSRIGRIIPFSRLPDTDQPPRTDAAIGARTPPPSTRRSAATRRRFAHLGGVLSSTTQWVHLDLPTLTGKDPSTTPALAFAPTGETLFVGVEDRLYSCNLTGSTYSFDEFQTWPTPPHISEHQGLMNLAVSESGDLLVGCVGSRVCVWDRNGKLLNTDDFADDDGLMGSDRYGQRLPAVLTRDRLVWLARGRLYVSDLDEYGTFTEPTVKVLGDRADEFAYAPDLGLVATGAGGRGFVRMYNMRTGEPLLQAPTMGYADPLLSPSSRIRRQHLAFGPGFLAAAHVLPRGMDHEARDWADLRARNRAAHGGAGGKSAHRVEGMTKSRVVIWTADADDPMTVEEVSDYPAGEDAAWLTFSPPDSAASPVVLIYEQGVHGPRSIALDVQSGDRQFVPMPEDAPWGLTFSPTGQLLAFVSKYRVWIRGAADRLLDPPTPPVRSGRFES